MKHLLALIVLILALTLVPSGLATADGGIEVIANQAQTDFPYSITFSLEAEAAVNITNISIECQVNRSSIVPERCRSTVNFEPGQHITANWTWNMISTGSIPPGTKIEYRWIIEDKLGNILESVPDTVRYDDLRYAWQNITDGQITIFWYEGNSSFAQQLMVAAQGALNRLSNEFNASLEQPVEFYIYANTWDLQGSLVNPDVWTGGIALPDYGTVMIGIEVDNLDWGKRTVAHELGHLVVGQLVYGPFGWLPTWLSEGIAMNAEGEMLSDFQDRLSKSISGNTLFSVRSIASDFPADSSEAKLCYAESYSVVRFLTDNYGSAKLLALLDAFKQGSTDDEALKQVYGFDTDGLNTTWRASLGLGPQPIATSTPTPTPGGEVLKLTAPYIALITIVVILSCLTIWLVMSFIRHWR